jgi:hypothetical protein
LGLSSLGGSQLGLGALTRDLLLGQLGLHLSHLALVLGRLQLQGGGDLVLDGLRLLQLGGVDLIDGQRLGSGQGGLGGEQLRSGLLVVLHGVHL